MPELENLKDALRAVQVGVWSWDIARDTITWSPEMRQLFEHGEATPVTYDAYLALIPVDERPPLEAVIDSAVRSAVEKRASATYVVEHRLVLSDGRTRWIEGRGQVRLDAEGRPARISGTAMDVTARKETEARLKESEELHRMFSELASDYVYVVDLAHPTLFPRIVTGSFQRTTGLSPKDVEARGGWLAVIHPDDLPALRTMLAAVPEGKPSVAEYRIVDGLGQQRWLRDSVRPVADPLTGKVVTLMGGVQDITERKRLEEQLLQAQKLAAVARLSGGIAHDFNNLLSVVMGSVAVLEGEVHSSDARESCQAIMEAATRGAELTKSLLVFARRDLGTPQLVDLSQVIRDAAPMLARAVGATISVVLEGTTVAAGVRIDPGQAQLVLLNLAVNARDAMPTGGTLRLTLWAGASGRAEGLPSELVPGNWVRLSVTDEGMGVDPKILPRLFEPFFTTKGLGNGLGLAACHGIVQAAGGSIQVTSTVGKGTTFTIYLPLSSQFEAGRRAPQARHSPGGTERILLVEDEQHLQRLLVRTLRDRGYTVVAADTAEHALTALAAERFDLVIADVMLPGRPGTELVAHVREHFPSTLTLLMSGDVGATALPDGVPVLAKPFTSDRLASEVREFLDKT